jgi:hypothetical protein
VLDPGGRLLAATRSGPRPSRSTRRTDGEAVLAPRVATFYDDGSRCPSDAYPLARAIMSGEPQHAVRGHGEDAATRWYAIDVHVLRRAPEAPSYGLVATFADVTHERDADLRRLPAPGSLGRSEAVPLDVARVLDNVPAQLLPEQLVAEARRLVEVPVALYVLDIDGTRLLRLAGSDDFPGTIAAPLALGPELAEDGLPELEERLARELPVR